MQTSLSTWIKRFSHECTDNQLPSLEIRSDSENSRPNVHNFNRFKKRRILDEQTFGSYRRKRRSNTANNQFFETNSEDESRQQEDYDFHSNFEISNDTSLNDNNSDTHDIFSTSTCSPPRLSAARRSLLLSRLFELAKLRKLQEMHAKEGYSCEGIYVFYRLNPKGQLEPHAFLYDEEESEQIKLTDSVIVENSV